jgi:hypothetical protein
MLGICREKTTNAVEIIALHDQAAAPGNHVGFAQFALQPFRSADQNIEGFTSRIVRRTEECLQQKAEAVRFVGAIVVKVDVWTMQLF